jgi:uncharacterized protein YjbJ (UPF0337 family)
MVDSNTISGTARDMAGRVQESVGAATGDVRTRVEGLANQGYGQARRAAGQASSVIREQPITIALAALVIGYVLGRVT